MLWSLWRQKYKRIFAWEHLHIFLYHKKMVKLPNEDAVEINFNSSYTEVIKDDDMLTQLNFDIFTAIS